MYLARPMKEFIRFGSKSLKSHLKFPKNLLCLKKKKIKNYLCLKEEDRVRKEEEDAAVDIFKR